MGVVMEILYTVNPGIEDIAANEVVSELGGTTSYQMLSGHVLHKPARNNLEALARLRSINRAFILLWKGNIGPRINDLIDLRRKLVSELEGISRYITPYTSFAVDTERVGEHEYTSMDISRVIGDVVIEVVKKETGERPPVNLRHPNIIVHVFVKDDKFYIGISLTGPWSMHRRGYRLYDHPAALKPTLAYAMLAISGTRDKQLIVDPMCGGGTIPIEAAYIHEDAYIFGYDQSPHHIRGARINALAAGVSRRIYFGVWDARRIHEVIEDVDHMVLNPPYGIRFGDPWTIRKLYSSFLSSAYKASKEGGHLTMITTEYNYVNKLYEKIGFKKVHERIVYHGRLYPHIIVLEK